MFILSLNRRILIAALLVFIPAPQPATAQTGRSDIRLVGDQALEVLRLLEAGNAGRPIPPEEWAVLFSTAGYRRLRQREEALGRPFTDSAFQAFVGSAELRSRAARLRATLAEWSGVDLTAAVARARAYLPAGARIQARLYPVIKPASNSFVFETSTDSAAIFLYLDPAVSAAQLENTLAHELHHIGYSAVCKTGSPKPPGSPSAALEWNAFGEGFAMLAAAGGPDVHPHAASDTAVRARWDRDLANAPADLVALEKFFTEMLDGRLTGDARNERGMSFFGVQGPWYTIGYLMAVSIERARGRAALVAVLCDPRRLILEYDRVSRESGRLPQWSRAFIDRLAPGS